MSNTAGQSSGRRMAVPLLLLLLQQLVFFLMLQPHAAAAAKTTFDPMTHNISPVTQQNWHGKVTASRTGQVFCILFYKDNCPACQKLIDNELNTVAKNLTGMVSVLGVNCDDSPKLCKDEKVTDYPSVVVYPLMPQPPVPYKGKMSVPALTSFVGRFIPSNLIIPKDMKDFRAAMGAVLQIPKVLVFSDKPEPSTIFKALSTAFKENLQLLYLDTEKFAELVQKYKADKLPHVVVTRKDSKDQVYTGELRFQPLFDWLNIFSETFARGGGFSDTQSTTEPSADTHPWRFQSVPELTKLSSADLCFKKTLKALCVIYLKEGKELSAAETEMLESLKYEYDSSSSKGGADFRWMWMDLATEKGFKELFKKDQLPSLVVFNPHLKTRFTSLEAEEVTKDSIKGLLEKISQGKKSSLASHTNKRLVHYKGSSPFEYHLYDSNARFKVVPSGKMPAWADRKEETKTAAQKKEKDEL